ncbi:MAG: hypothetical protein ABIR64_10185 [Candidatus Limnocylindrales bacterium]
MRRRTAIAMAWLLCVAGAIGLALTAGVGGGLAEDSQGFPFTFVGLALVVATDATVGAVLMLRRPGNVVGLGLMVAAVLLGVTFLAFPSAAILTDARGTHDALAGFVSLVAGLGIYPSVIVAGPLLALVFPDGKLPGARWKWPAGLIVALFVVGSAMVTVRPGSFGGSLADNPIGVSGLPLSPAFWALGDVFSALTLPLSLVLALAAVVVRVRRAGEVERAQLKWFVAAYLVAVVLISISFVDGTTQTVIDVLAPWSLALPSLAVGIAVLRYRLFEIDRIISRTVGWAVVTGMLLAVFAGAVVGLQALLSSFTQGETLAVAASTLVAFALFQPLRRRVQAAVNRRFDRARVDADRTVTAFADRLRDQIDLGGLEGDISRTVEAALRPSSTGVWIRGASR